MERREAPGNSDFRKGSSWRKKRSQATEDPSVPQDICAAHWRRNAWLLLFAVSLLLSLLRKSNRGGSPQSAYWPASLITALDWKEHVSASNRESRGNEGDVCGRVSLLLKTPFLFWGVDWHKKSLKHNFPGNSSHLETSLALPRRASIFLDRVHAPAATTVLEMKYGAGRQSCYYFTFHCASSF